VGPLETFKQIYQPEIRTILTMIWTLAEIQRFPFDLIFRQNQLFSFNFVKYLIFMFIIHIQALSSQRFTI
jgi:hypothetical protein